MPHSDRYSLQVVAISLLLSSYEDRREMATNAKAMRSTVTIVFLVKMKPADSNVKLKT